MKTKEKQTNNASKKNRSFVQYLLMAIFTFVLLVFISAIYFVHLEEDQNPSYPSDWIKGKPILVHGNIDHATKTGMLNISQFNQDDFAMGEFISGNEAYYVIVEPSLLKEAGIKLNRSENGEKYYSGNHTLTITSQKIVTAPYPNVDVYQVKSIR